MRVAVLLVALGAGVSVFAQAAAETPQTPQIPQTPQTPPAIWAGVFSPAQAGRGAAVVATHCTRCHGEGRSLSGDVFMLHWEGHNLARLFQKLQTMPPKSEVLLTAQQRIDAMAYLLQQNGFPPGANDLADDTAALTNILIMPQGGPRPMQSGAIVATVGCLVKGASNAWQLTRATEPEATVLDPSATGAKDDRANGAVHPAHGTKTFQLLNPFPDPAEHAGHTVEVKGLLIRNLAGDRINVVSVETLADRCDQ
jgi:mono/diheme cytochrome c family protein